MNTKGKDYIEYCDYRFKRQKDNYFRSTTLTDNKRIALHRLIYEMNNGTIPSGHEIHHKDGDKDNNDIENLGILTYAEHRKHHNIKDGLNKQLAERNKDSEYIKKCQEGRQKLHAIKFNKNCINCGSEFETSILFKDKQFCNLKCYWKWYNKNKRNKITK